MNMDACINYLKRLIATTEDSIQTTKQMLIRQKHQQERYINLFEVLCDVQDEFNAVFTPQKLRELSAPTDARASAPAEMSSWFQTSFSPPVTSASSSSASATTTPNMFTNAWGGVRVLAPGEAPGDDAAATKKARSV